MVAETQIVTSHTPGLAAKAADAIKAGMIVLVAALGVLFVLFVIIWAAMWRLMGDEPNAQGRAFDLTMILCGFGFVLLVLVVAFGAAMITSIRHTSLSASAGMQRTIETLAQQTERTNERAAAKDEAMLRMIEIMMRNGTLPQLPQTPTQTAPRRIDLPDDTWIKTSPNAMQRISRTELPVERETVALHVNGESIDVALNKIGAMIRCYPKPTQREFVANGGGETTSYAEVGELLCNCNPPLLLRSPNRAGAFVFAAERWPEVQEWLDAHGITANAIKALPSPAESG